MVTVQLKGRITQNGKLEVELPEGLPEGEVEVTIEVPISEAEAPLIEEELSELLKPVSPKTGAEIAAEIEAGLIGDGWSDVQISGAEWVEAQRHKRKERRGW